MELECSGARPLVGQQRGRKGHAQELQVRPCAGGGRDHRGTATKPNCLQPRASGKAASLLTAAGPWLPGHSPRAAQLLPTSATLWQREAPCYDRERRHAVAERGAMLWQRGEPRCGRERRHAVAERGAMLWQRREPRCDREGSHQWTMDTAQAPAPLLMCGCFGLCTCRSGVTGAAP